MVCCKVGGDFSSMVIQSASVMHLILKQTVVYSLLSFFPSPFLPLSTIVCREISQTPSSYAFC